MSAGVRGAGWESKTAVKEAMIYIDGQFYTQENAKVSVFDHGLLYGDGIFEGIRFYEGRVFRLEEHIDRLADHAFYAELWEKAVPYQLHSCRRAVRRGANHDAVSIFERGIETLSHLSPSEAKTKAEIDFRLAVILALEPLGRHRRIVDVLLDARLFAADSDDPRRLAAVNCHLAIALWRLGDFDGAMAAAEAAKAIAEGVDGQVLMFAALNAIGVVHHGTGSFAKTVEMHRKCLALETPELDDKRAGCAGTAARLLHQRIENRQEKGGGFSTASLGACEQIASGQCRRYGIGLNRRRPLKAEVFDAA